MLGEVIFKRAQAFAVENSSTILSGIGVVGTVTTAVLTGRAAFKAADLINEEYTSRMEQNSEALSTKDKLILVGPQFIPPVGVGGITIASIIYANRISTSKAAAMAAAYALSDKTFSEYKEKAAERLGVTKETDLRDEIAQGRVKAMPPGQTIIIGSGEVLCFDVLTSRYFMGNMEKIKKAENEINGEILTCDGASLSRFYDEIGLQPNAYSDTVGWDIDNRCEVQVSAVMTDDERPCLSVDFKSWPKPDYGKAWLNG